MLTKHSMWKIKVKESNIWASNINVETSGNINVETSLFPTLKKINDCSKYEWNE